MVTFPNAKINIGLDILSKRPDGFHNIHSCFYPIPFSDILEIVTAESFEFSSSGIEIPGAGNLCVEAFEMIKADHDIGNVKIHLHKIIPIGAGLGGGSADATFTIKMLSELFHLNLSDVELQGYAARLGSDCPFFVKNKVMFASSTGTDLLPIDLSLTGKHLVLISPGVHVSTAEAYGGVTPDKPAEELQMILKSTSLEDWKENVKNDFEKSVFANHPEIGLAKQELYSAGALYASMTGSGSALYGIFKEKPTLSTLKTPVCWNGLLE